MLKYRGAPDLDFAGDIVRNRLTLVVHSTYLHSRKGFTDVARNPLTLERIGKSHANLGHSVSLQQGLPADRSPCLERGNWQGGRPGDHQAQLAAALRVALLIGLRGIVPGSDQPCINRRHGHEQA